MAGRISPKAKPGSLLKSGERKHDDDYLELIRRCPCLACDTDPAGEAAHLRMAGPGKPITGMGIKPAAMWVLPLCPVCHRLQHAAGEVPFWNWLGLDPFAICHDLWKCHGIEEMRAVIFAAREKRK